MEIIQAKKIGMTQLFDDHNRLVPVTIVSLVNPEREVMLEAGKIITIVGVSKGKGFQGVMKKHGAKGAPASHGRKHDMRRVGSIGSGWPERVMKGKKMPGRMGSQRVTIKNLRIMKVDSVNNLIAMNGAVPGARGSLIKINMLSE